MDKLLERFLHYVSLDTQSKPGVRQVPSTEGQWKLLNLLKEQLEAMGLVDVTLSEKGTVMGTLPANIDGDIRVAFTPDEEVGKGAKHFDVEAFNAQWAYTVDGGGVGELEYENFNAASVTIKIVGNNVHPGSAKGVMVNALSLAARIHAEVPAEESPEMTEGYEGFYHLTSIKGTVDSAQMHYIVRDFDRKAFEARKRKMMEIAKKVGKGLHPDCYIELIIEDSYYNMRDKVMEHPHILDIAQQAMRDCDIEPVMKPIRGGTDGSQLSFMGLPCPNLFTGGYNYHGKHEFVTLEGMEKAVQVIVRIAELTAKR
ncbi:peptidase T [Enterobacter hormaechei]|uniref:peptidase T n=1 Tax=Enterobacter hormaechei TaxID=158836 RepID=UPI0035662AAA